jgi:transposase
MRKRSPERVRVWRDLLDAWKQSGQTVNAFCRDRKLTRSNFDRWRRILAAESAKSKPSPFVPLRVVAEPMAEVVLPSGILVRLPLTTPPDAVTRLVAAVGAAAC